MRDFTLVPDSKDVYEKIAPTLETNAEFGTSLGKYVDMEGTGINGILVGAPGEKIDLSGNIDSSTTQQVGGSAYIVFLRRRRYHQRPPNLFKRYFIIALPLFLFIFVCGGGAAFFFYYFRRKPDEIEKIVKASGLEISATRRRKKRDFNADKTKVYADNYN